MENGMLPKSLHTVRILVAVARFLIDQGQPRQFAALEAARVVGYEAASLSDPLIVKATAQLAGVTARKVAA